MVMVCCDRLPALFISRIETRCFSAGLISPSGQVVAAVCWESAGAVCWDLPHFFPCSKVKLLLDNTGSAVKRRWMARRTKPHIESSFCNFHTCHILQQWGETTPRATFKGNSRLTKHWRCGRPADTFPSRWRVITYILPKIRICSFCHIYTNSDLQGEYRWQVIRVQLQRDKSCSLLHF